MNFSTAAHGGDCAWSLRMLMQLGGEHNFYCQPEYLDALREAMAHTHIQIHDISQRPADAIDTWIANAQFEDKGVFYQDQGDIMGFVLNYMNHVGGKCGTPAPLFTNREQFLFDVPPPTDRMAHYDILVVNAQPCSGQVLGFDNAELNALIERLATRNSVICTNPTTAKNALVVNASLLRIAHLSQRCGCIIGIATGPLWLTFNRANRTTPRHVLLNPMHLDYGPTVPITNHLTVASIEQAMFKGGWL